MRLLHTSDWHLGRTLKGFDLHDAQSRAVDQIVSTAIDSECDAFLIAGDVFDRAVPPVQSVVLFGDALRRLSAAGITTIVTAGNHDSGPRLAAYSGVLADNVHIVGPAYQSGIGIEIGTSAVVYPLPYLNPDEARTALADDEMLERSHEAVMRAALDRVARDRRSRQPGLPTIISAHAFVAGGAESDSERDIAVGGVPVVPSTLFADASYVALGHLHRPQEVNAPSPMRYSGSLLRYSLSESDQDKSFHVVDFSDTGEIRELATIAIDQPRPMARLRGTLDELLSPVNAAHRDSFVELVVTDERMPERMHARLDEAFPFAVVKRREVNRSHGEAITLRGGGASRTPRDSIFDFLEKTTGVSPNADEERIIDDALENVP